MRKLQGMGVASKMNIAFKVRLYNAYIRPILLYNSGTLGLAKFWTDKLDATLRRHLRRLAVVFYPNHISNRTLYTTYASHPISWDVRQARWNLSGHVLWLSPQSPAQAALDLCYATQILGNERTSWKTSDRTDDSVQGRTTHDSRTELNISRP